MIPSDIHEQVAHALAEDIGAGDITAALISEETVGEAVLITREPAVICGQPWVDAVYAQLDPSVQCAWQVAEGQEVAAETALLTVKGSARAVLTGERCAMNWLQTLSGVATVVHEAVKVLADYPTVILDTRKTIPGLRGAQKYAVTVGGGHNHRMGLFDAFLIKENHIMACGSIQNAVAAARKLGLDALVEVEVESLEELEAALEAGADVIMLDNFTHAQMQAAVGITQQRARLEVSGNVSLSDLPVIAQTGVDFISMGALTKHLRAIDLSMRWVDAS